MVKLVTIFNEQLNGLAPEITTTLKRVFNNDAGLTSLTISESQGSDNVCKALATALYYNSMVFYLYLGSNKIGLVGSKFIANTLANNKTISSLFLSNNLFGNLGADYIANALLINTSLTYLDMSENLICDIGTKHFARALLKNKKLENLDLSTNSISALGAQYLARALLNNTTVRRLWLFNNKIGDAGAKEIANTLLTNRSITSLSLSTNNIGDVGAISIADALKSNNTLEHLVLHDNNIGNAAAEAFNNALETNITLTSFELTSINILPETLAKIKLACKRNATFKQQIREILDPLYKNDENNIPVWQSNPLQQAHDLNEVIKEVDKNPIFRKSVLLQELEGLKHLCVAQACFDFYLDKNTSENAKKDLLIEIIKNLQIVEGMGFHFDLVYKLAQDMITKTTNAQDRLLLNTQLPGSQNPERKKLTEVKPVVCCAYELQSKKRTAEMDATVDTGDVAAKKNKKKQKPYKTI